MNTHSQTFGINLIGYASANMGLGHTTREFARIILDRGVPLSIFDVDAGHGRSNYDFSFGPYINQTRFTPKYCVNLAIGGAEVLPHWMIDSLSCSGAEACLNAAFFWWELPDLPLHWVEAARAFDVLIAGSEFIQATMANSVPGVPVLLARHPIRMPSHVAPDRERFGLPPEALLVFTGFEPSSDPTRKNPFAAIEAFRRAFSDRSDCRLVIKINNPNVEGPKGALLKKMYTTVGEDNRIILIKGNLPYVDLLSLYASCDVFISLHRSEGLGLMPLEAMRLGKPVVATGWSGNMSYMNHRNACLVTYKLLPTDDSSPAYGPSRLRTRSHWAEPDIDQAAAWLKKLSTDSKFRSRVGEQAARDSAIYETRAGEANFIDELKALWENRALLPLKNRTQLKERINQTYLKMRWDKLNPFRRLASKLSYQANKQLGKYVLWRFSKHL